MLLADEEPALGVYEANTPRGGSERRSRSWRVDWVKVAMGWREDDDEAEEEREEEGGYKR